MNLKNYFLKAKKGGWAIGQFNFSSMEQLRGILDAAKNLRSPVILGTSMGESDYLGLEETVALVEISKVKYNIDAFLNLDHGKDVTLIKKAVDSGYSAVHFDGSGLSLKENIKIVKDIVEYAHKKNVLVEGELGSVKGESVFHSGKASVADEKDLTSLEDVDEFVRQTKADSLAVSIGNIHGVYKGGKNIDLKRLEDISKKCKAFLVLHGGSDIKKEDIIKAVKLGIVKININTELRMAWHKAMLYNINKGEIKPYKVFPRVQKQIQKKVEEKIKIFGSKGKLI
jgi:ketose-bisphosphate aldolase